MKIIQITLAALLVVAVAAVAGIGQPEPAGGAADEPKDGITVTGTGQVSAVPDEAEFSLGVTTKGQTARDALTANSAQMRRLIEALKTAGVAEREIRTQDVSVGPAYDGSGKVGGFSARNSVSVHIRDLNRAGAILDAASQAGANEIYGPMLRRSDRDALAARALKDAVPMRANAPRRSRRPPVSRSARWRRSAISPSRTGLCTRRPHVQQKTRTSRSSAVAKRSQPS
jgi:uncharacterized protein YggE